MIRKNLLILLLAMLCFAGSAHAQLIVLYKCGETNLESPMIKPFINIINESETPYDLKDITVRYFYTKEGEAFERYQVEYAVVGSSYVKVAFEQGFFDISFPDINMSIPPLGGETGIIQIKINKQDWSNYDQRDDYSFNPTFSELREFSRIALYYQGMKIWGNEHFKGPSPTPNVPPK
jgi:cellulose 1,4-beta-cellobiosidase